MIRRKQPFLVRSTTGALLILALGAVACIGDGPTGPEPIPLEETEFDPELGIDLAAMTRTDEGLYYLDLKTGEGEVVAEGDSIAFHYTGWLANGYRFGTTVGKEPLSVRLNLETLIAGFVVGVPGMKVGGKRKLVIPSYLAYGPYAVGDIPSYANLVYDVEIVAIHEEDEEEGAATTE